MNDHGTDPATEVFVAHRDLLFTVAYEMLGSAADAEDVLQEAWLRWVEVDLAQVRDQRAYLVRITTRQALMFILETLSPTERAVFVLREVFDIGYDDIAAAIGKSPAAARQIAYRARRHVDARRPRTPVSPEETRATLNSFQRALVTGDLQGLLDVLAPDVVFVSDGGGLRLAALRPVVGAGKVLRYMAGSLEKAGGSFTGETTTVNGNPGLILRLDDVIDGVLAFRVENARVTGIYYVRNPEKLTRVESETPLTSR